MFSNPNAYIGRWVVLLSPVFLAIAAGIVNFAQAKFGIELDKDQLVILLSATFLSLAGLIAQWLKNKGVSEVVQSQQEHENAKNNGENPATGLPAGDETDDEVDLDQEPPSSVPDGPPLGGH